MLAIGAPAPTCQRTPAKFSASVMPPAVDGLRFHREPLELSAADAQQLVVLLPADETTEKGGDLDGGRLARRLAGRRPRGTLHLLLMLEPLQADPAAISAFSALQKLLNRAKAAKIQQARHGSCHSKCHSIWFNSSRIVGSSSTTRSRA